MTMPEQMTNRCARRRDPAPGERTLYWHVLMRDYPEVGDVVQQARSTCCRWLSLCEDCGNCAKFGHVHHDKAVMT